MVLGRESLQVLLDPIYCLAASQWDIRVGDDNIERVLVVLEELKPIADVNFDGRMLESNGHRW
jgi:hypothetical protein